MCIMWYLTYNTEILAEVLKRIEKILDKFKKNVLELVSSLKTLLHTGKRRQHPTQAPQVQPSYSELVSFSLKITLIKLS